MRAVASAVMLLVGFAPAAVGQFVPAGPELRVNSDYFYTASTAETVAGTPTGEFVVVWEWVADDVNYGIRARRYDNASVPQGPDFEVPTSISSGSDRATPAVGSDASGNFIVVWNDEHGPHIIEARRFDSDGMPLGADFTLNENPADYPNHPRVDVQPDGDFVVVWLGGPGPDLQVVGRVFDGMGTPVGGEFTV